MPISLAQWLNFAFVQRSLFKFYIMKPIHRMVQGNCLELMRKIPDNYIDFICADFPYNISNNA